MQDRREGGSGALPTHIVYIQSYINESLSSPLGARWGNIRVRFVVQEQHNNPDM